MADYNLEGVIRLRDETSEAVKSADQSVNKFEGTLKAAKAALTAFGVVEAAKAAIELGKLGAQAERTERGFTAISGGSAAAEANLNAMIGATDGAISRTDGMAAASKLMQMGLANNATELGNLTEMAVRLGTAMGRDANQSIEEFSLLLANQSIPRLDTFGISAGKVRGRIQELQDQTAGMTREAAFMQAVMEEGAVAMGRLGPAVEDNALAVEKAAAAWANLKVEIGQRFASTVAGSHSVIGKFTTLWGDNLRIMNQNSGEIGTLRANIGMLGDVLGFNNTVFDEYRDKQRAHNAETQRMAGLAEYYAEKQELANQATEAGRDVLSDSELAWLQYSEATQGATQAQADYEYQQRLANEAAAAAETSFLNAAAALDELSAAALARNELELLKQELDAGKISQEQYRDATRAILTEFGLLTPAEEKAQQDLEYLRQAFANGRITAEEFATAVERVKNRIDALEDKTVNITYIYREEDRRKGAGAGYSSEMWDTDWQAAGFEGWVNEPTPMVVGEGGPEYVSIKPAAQVQNTTNINVSMPQATNVGPAIAALQALYGAN